MVGTGANPEILRLIAWTHDQHVVGEVFNCAYDKPGFGAAGDGNPLKRWSNPQFVEVCEIVKTKF